MDMGTVSPKAKSMYLLRLCTSGRPQSWFDPRRFTLVAAGGLVGQGVTVGVIDWLSTTKEQGVQFIQFELAPCGSTMVALI